MPMKDTVKKKIIKWFWIIVAAPFAILILAVTLVGLFAEIPSFEELEHPDNKLATQVIAENGEVLTTFHIENRTYVSYEELSPYLVAAAVATEDARFYEHSGIDMKSLARVLVKTILMQDSSQGGGSTITQQLAKTLYPRRQVNSRIPGWSAVVMVQTKLKEWITAVKLERDYTKNEIMDMYLNSIFFGSGAYGVKAASETFFSKEPADLTVEEAALLVGMVNKPTRYNPVLNPDYSLQRRNFVIGQMERNGYLTEAERDSLCNIPIQLQYQVLDHNAGLAPYFRDMLRRDMNAEKPERSEYQYAEDYAQDSLRWREDPIYGWLNKNRKPDGSSYDLDRDGLRIYTTINYKMQQYAEEAVDEYLGGHLQHLFDQEVRWKRNKPFANSVDDKTAEMLMQQARRWSDRYRLQHRAGKSDAEIYAQFSEPARMRVFAWNDKGYVDTTMTPDDSIRYYKSILRCGFVAIEPGTGHVKAYVGGPDYRYFKYDNVSQGKRQIGSTVKPFLYTLAMQEGMTPCDKVVNLPQTFVLYDGTTWTPRSTDRAEYIGQTVTLRWGLSRSSNNISAYLMKEFGPSALAAMMRQMGISTHIDEVYSLCVGPAEVNVFDMVSAYNTFPSHGTYVYPQYVTRITDSEGVEIGRYSTRKREAISEQTAYLMVDLMKAVINEGTGTRLRSVYGLKGEIAGKTGTTNDNSDGWFIGYTPNITAGVWVGGEDRQVHFNSLALGSGSNMSLPIWGIWMKKCLADPTIGWSEFDTFAPPATGALTFDCDTEGIFLGGYSEDYVGSESVTGASEEEDYYFN
ncbi:MAG: transglycosylase domain-containing protein [Bacteroidetes bacterium]|uniref:Transglycosylase domain-containing protein n=1 Tax=Candidatus Cryptobacteroides avistercoris TaxID=2840758 RepID=A0A9D9IYC0_9BACT|nr:transglycosylase domain-containing protein [Candidatus Cryptobacteroides avistercoris]